MFIPPKKANFRPRRLVFKFVEENEARGQGSRTHGSRTAERVFCRNIVTEEIRSTSVVNGVPAVRDGSYLNFMHMHVINDRLPWRFPCHRAAGRD